MKRLFLVLIAGMLVFSSLSAQYSHERDNNIRLDRRFGVSAKFGGAYGILGGMALDAFICPWLNAELDYLPIPILSSISYYGGGINIHPLGGNKSHWSPYLGLFYGFASGTAFLSGEHEEYHAVNFPLGIQYIHENGLSFTIELGFAWVRETIDFQPFYRDDFYPPPSIKIGYRF